MPTHKDIRELFAKSSLEGPTGETPRTAVKNTNTLLPEWLQPDWEGKGVLPWLGETVAKPHHALMAGLDAVLPGGKVPKVGSPFDRLGRAMMETYAAPADKRAEHHTEQLLADRGIDFPGRSGVSFISDMALDPLNVVAPLKVTKNLGRASRALQRTFPALEAKKLQVLRDFVRPHFSATAGMRPEVAEATRLAQAAHRTAPERTVEKLFQQKLGIEDPAGVDLTALDRLTNTQLKQRIGKLQHRETWEEIDKWLARQDKEKLLEKTHASEIVKLGDVKGLSRELDVTPELLASNPAEAARRQAYAQKDVLRDFAENLKPQKGRQQSTKAGDAYRNLMQWWKKQVTVHNPRFLMNNSVGNMGQIMAASDGSLLTNNPWTASNTIRKGGVWQAEKAAGKFDPAQKVGEYTQQEIADALKRYGVDTGLAQHITYDPDNIEKVVESVRKAHEPFLNSKNPLKLYSKGMTAANDFSEKSAKIGVVLEALEKGKTLPEALIDAKRTLFDYQELTPALKNVRDMGVPFLTFAAKNLPLQLRNVVDKPAQLATIQRWVESGDREAKAAGTFVPDNERYASSVNNMDPLTGKKGPNGESVYRRNVFPLGDINLLGLLREGQQGEEALKLLLDKAGPLPQIALDLAKARDSKNRVPATGLMGSVPVNAGLEVALSTQLGGVLDKEVGQYLGLNRYESKKDKSALEYRMPWLGKTAVNTVLPITNTLGRAGLAYSEPDLATDPYAWKSWLGYDPQAIIKPASRAANKKSNTRQKSGLVQEKKRQRKAIFDEGEL